MSIYLAGLLSEGEEASCSNTENENGVFARPQDEETILTSHQNNELPTTICCSRCGELIHDRYYVVLEDQTWHMDCLQCCVCSVRLGQQVTCFVKNRMVFCREDYHRQFTKRCTRCRRPLSPKDLVMRAREYIYHVQCFICIICCCPLQPGEFFALGENGVLYCQAHYEPLLQMGATSTITHPHCAESMPNELGGTKGRHRKRKSAAGSPAPSLPSDSMLNCTFDPVGMGRPMSASSGIGGDQSMRTKRMRTSFKHHQLRTMKAYFALNHNPDAKDLKQLAQKTGLTKRVLQVWFQNARAKYRRAMSIRPDGTSIAPTPPPGNILPSEDSMGDTTLEAGSSDEPEGRGCEAFQNEAMENDDTIGLDGKDKCCEDNCSGDDYNSDDSCASRTLAEYFQTESGLL